MISYIILQREKKLIKTYQDFIKFSMILTVFIINCRCEILRKAGVPSRASHNNNSFFQPFSVEFC